MKTSRKQELKGAFKAIVAIAILGLMIGIGVATTLMSDEGFFKDGNEVLVEGDYTTWTHKWSGNISNSVGSPSHMALHIDDVNEVYSLIWRDSDDNDRFGIYNLADNTTVNESLAASDYQHWRPHIDESALVFQFGNAALSSGGVSRSLQTYILLLKKDGHTIEVWRAGSSVLWSWDTQNDGAIEEVYVGAISPTGKYIIVIQNKEFGGNTTIMCYEGS